MKYRLPIFMVISGLYLLWLGVDIISKSESITHFYLGFGYILMSMFISWNSGFLANEERLK